MERVLVVDDEADALEILSWMLIEHGCEVRTASGVEQALEVGREFHPTLLITDYLLQDDATGIDVIRDLRELDPNLKAVLITGMDAIELRKQLSSVGNVTVIHKPFGWADLRTQLDELAAAG